MEVEGVKAAAEAAPVAAFAEATFSPAADSGAAARRGGAEQSSAQQARSSRPLLATRGFAIAAGSAWTPGVDAGGAACAALRARADVVESCVARHTWHTHLNVCFARTTPRLNLIHSEATFFARIEAAVANAWGKCNKFPHARTSTISTWAGTVPTAAHKHADVSATTHTEASLAPKSHLSPRAATYRWLRWHGPATQTRGSAPPAHRPPIPRIGIA